MSPLNPAVVTVGSFHAGTTYNVIPGEAVLTGTTRTFDRKVWHSWPERLEKIIKGVCDSMGAQYLLNYTQGYPPTVNDEALSAVVRNCAMKVSGPEMVLEPEPTMGGEDMAFYLDRSQGCFFFLGVGRQNSAPLHNSKFDFDEQMLLKGVEAYCRIALELLNCQISNPVKKH
jgi:amidohydrolase